MAHAQAVQGQDADYLLGHSNDELDRLIGQARFFGDLTEHLFHLAGLEPGMRVLDVGCGAGDVSLLAARMVGPQGAVVGVDMSPDAIRMARERADAAGLANVAFLTQDVADLDLDAPVDALVGRLVLMYFPDPAAVLRGLLRYLRPGGLVVFQEMDMGAVVSEPHCALLEETAERIRQTFARAGADPRAGLKLWRIFRSAGLPAPQMIQEARVEAGPDSEVYTQVARIARTLLPLMERTGVATAAEVEIETLEARLRDEVVANRAVVVAPPFVGAWATVD
jgi:ubiquinone/menaquinone biosynthesis C-methylase UbiE